MVLITFRSFKSSGMTGFDFVIPESACFCSGWQRFPYPLVARIIANLARVPEVFKKAFAGFTFAPSMALA